MPSLLATILLVLLLFTILEVAYFYLLAVASLKSRPKLDLENYPCRFAVVIPAYNEAAVIADTINAIRLCAYPQDLIEIFVVADHCTDNTAEIVSQSGARCYERLEGERTGKGPALSWLLQRIFKNEVDYQAVAVFDADTRVHPQFFNVMSARLSAGDQVIQGNHVIRNDRGGWFPALTWAMFLIDNRVQNLGRANLGLSAKNMGDSICFASGVLRWFGWGKGLADDYALRQKLLLEGILIGYEPSAIGFGYAAPDWNQAKFQRSRWLQGTFRVSRLWAHRMLLAGIKRRDLALLDGALQSYLPSYSTLALFSIVFLCVSLFLRSILFAWLPIAWGFALVLMGLFPYICLALDRAPLRAYLVITSGPVYILWRTWLSTINHLSKKEMSWVRSQR